MTTTAIARYIEAPLGERHEYARALASAGDLIPRSLFGPPTPAREGHPARPPEPSPGKVLLVLETGAMLGLHPIAALSGINVIEGKPAASAGLMSAVIRGAGHKLHTVESGSIEGGDYKAVTTLIRDDDPDHPFVSTWTPQRAARADLCSYTQGADDVWRVSATSKGGAPLPWQLYTESLCKARGVSEVARDGAQDALFGVRYTPEELGAVVDFTGEVVTLSTRDEPEAEPATPSALPPARKRATKGTQGTKRATGPTEAPEPADEPTAPQGGPGEEIAVPVEDEPAQGELTPEVERELAEAALESLDRSDTEAVARYNETHGKILGRFATSDADRAARSDSTPEELAQQDAEARERIERNRIAREQEDAAREAEAAAADTGERVTYVEPIEDANTVLPGSVESPASEYFLATAEEPENYPRRMLAAVNLDQLREVWDDAQAKPGAMTSDLRLKMMKRKAQITAWSESAAEGGPTETLDEFVARIESQEG